jgi:hypothetical protein
MLNSYSNFLRFAANRAGASIFLADLRAADPVAFASANGISASGEEVVLENELRDIVGRAAWSNDELRKLFVANQDKLPDLYAGKAVAMQLSMSDLNIRTALTKARAVLVVVSPITPIKTDDALIVMIDAFLADADMMGWLKAKAAAPAPADGTLSLEAEPETLQLSLKRNNIDFGKVMAALPILLELIRMFRG